MARRADYQCENCGHVTEMFGTHPQTITAICGGCGHQTVHERLWTPESVPLVVIPAGFTRDKINQSMRPRIHTFTPNGVVTQEG